MDELEMNVEATQRAENRWANVAVVSQNKENADTPAQAKLKWGKVYRLFDAKGETQQDEAFAAIQMYFLSNGASPKGKYQKPITTAGGVSVEAGLVVAICGRLDGEIRQFLRGKLHDSYLFLKHNPRVVEDPTVIAVAQNAGVPKSKAWLMADWLGRDCEYFVGDEAEVYNRLRTARIAAAQAKLVAAVPQADRVHDNTPESKMSNGVASRGNVSYDEKFF